MKNLFKNILAVLSATLFSVCAVAQTGSVVTADDVNAIMMSKIATPNDDGTYTLTLESYITGYISNSTSIVTTSAPLDVVLVLDVSGSMGDNISSTSYTARSSQAYNYNSSNVDSYYYKHTDGNYYKVTKERGSIINSYTARTSQAYTYDGYGSNQYYYKHTDNNYYLVSRSVEGTGNNKKYYLSYTVGGQTYYLSGTTTTTVQPTNITQTNRTIWTGVLYSTNSTTTYRLYYNVNGTKYYLSGNSSSTEVREEIYANTTLYTGILYSASTTSKTKLAALKTAVDEFITNIASKSTDKATHRIALVKFASDNSNTIGNGKNSSGYNYSQIVQGLTDMTQANATSLISTVNGLSAAGATRADYGMNHAKNIINGITGERAEKSIKLVVMFTDGAPTTSSTFSNTVANSAISSGKDLKDKGVSVYTVGVFNNPSDNILTYMNYVSSNYPSATSMDNGGTPANTQKYSMTASSADELKNIFATISEEATSQAGNGSQYNVEKEQVVIKDIVTPSFDIPEGDSMIKFYVASAQSIQTNDYSEGSIPEYGDVTWSELTEAEGVEFVKNESEDGRTTVDVKGFDFSGNWVGYQDKFDNGTRTEHNAHGSKLVIKIIVYPDPDAEGGYVSTNAPGSGFYVDGVLIKGFVNPAPVATPMDMRIIVNTGTGVTPNGRETIIFDLYEILEDGSELFLLSAAAPFVDGSSVTITKLLVGPKESPVVYKVVPRDSWSYKYQVRAQNGDSLIQQALFTYNSETQELTNTNEFHFYVNANGDKVKTRGDESNKLNVFK